MWGSKGLSVFVLLQCITGFSNIVIAGSKFIFCL